MAPERDPDRKARSLASKLRRLNLCGTRRERSITPKSGARADPRPDISHTPYPPSRLVLPSRTPPREVLRTCQRQAGMEPSRVIFSEQVADHMQLAGSTSRQRRDLEPCIRSGGNISQSPRRDASNFADGRGGSSSGLDRHNQRQTPFAQEHHNGKLVNTQQTPRQVASVQLERGKANADQLVPLVEPMRDRPSDSLSVYSDEVPDEADGRQDRHRPIGSDRIAASPRKTNNNGKYCGQTLGKIDGTLGTPKVDLPRLYVKMEIARRGTCQDCRRYGREHMIIRGLRSLICSSCGQDHDCSNWEEVNVEPSHKLLREPLGSPPPTFPCTPRPPPGTLKPPPPLKDRPYATGIPLPPLKNRAHAVVTPLLNPDLDPRQRPATSASEHDPESYSSPTSPIAVTKALPLPRGSRARRLEPAKDDSQARYAPEKEVYKASKDVNRVNYLRHKLENRDLASDSGPLPAIYAVQELAKATKGTSLIRTGEVKSYKGRLHRELADKEV
jgi:hypothetical protein